MHDLDEMIRERRSVRGFVPDRPVPRHLIGEALELAQRAPSNCNVQPWRVFIASGVGCDRLRSALTKAATMGVAPTPDDPVDEFPGSYRRLQVDCAIALYKEMGVDRHDQAGRLRAFVRNFEFFDAPHVAIVCMEEHFKLGVTLDVGMYVQTLMLALWARGVASCAQASLRMYPAIVRRELGIPEALRILCGVSFGFEDASVPANRTRQRREPIERNIKFIDE
jgi:nitroreductase